MALAQQIGIGIGRRRGARKREVPSPEVEESISLAGHHAARKGRAHFPPPAS